MESSEISKLVANVPYELKEFVNTQSKDRGISISRFISQLLEDSKRKQERMKSLNIFEKHTSNLPKSDSDAVENVRTLRNSNLNA